MADETAAATVAPAPESASSTTPAPPATPTPSASSDEITARQSDGELLQLVSFMVGTEEFAIPILAVQEINRMMQITRVPQSPAFIEGVINLRGKIIPVMDMRKRFSMTVTEDNSDMRIIVVEVGGAGGRVIGFTVDRVNEVLRIGKEIVEPAPAMVCGGLETDYVEGVGKIDDRLLILLNLERLFSSEEMKSLDQALQEDAS